MSYIEVKKFIPHIPRQITFQERPSHLYQTRTTTTPCIKKVDIAISFRKSKESHTFTIPRLGKRFSN